MIPTQGFRITHLKAPITPKVTLITLASYVSLFKVVQSITAGLTIGRLEYGSASKPEGQAREVERPPQQPKPDVTSHQAHNRDEEPVDRIELHEKAKARGCPHGMHYLSVF